LSCWGRATKACFFKTPLQRPVRRSAERPPTHPHPASPTPSRLLNTIKPPPTTPKKTTGYENLAWLKGGYNAWYNTFDNKLKRRVYGEYAETYMHDGDSCGIHASGAGFARVDAIERIRLPVY
jgi:hypothetical protein